MKNLTVFAAIAFALVVTGCSNSRTDAGNKALKSHRAGSAGFKQELALQLAYNPADFTCTLKNYFVKDNQEYLTVDIKRADFSTTEIIAVKSWNKLGGIQSAKGLGYTGARLKGLRLVADKTGDQTDLVYQDVEQIVD